MRLTNSFVWDFLKPNLFEQQLFGAWSKQIELLKCCKLHSVGLRPQGNWLLPPSLAELRFPEMLWPQRKKSGERC